MQTFLASVCKVFVLVLCLAEISTALECLACTSSDLYSECRLGQRKGRPKLQDCGENSKCYAIAQIHDNATATFKRGCTIDPDFCDFQDDLEFCQTCRSQFCNYWPMDVSQEVREYLGQEEPPAVLTTRKPVRKHGRRRVIVRPLFKPSEK